MGTLLLALALAAGMQFHQDFTNAVLTLSGAGTIEELSESELERYQHFADHPLDLNAAGRARLLASGLLSGYQAASLLDYKSRSGDILSFGELALIDGFSPAVAGALSHFCVLKTRDSPGAAPSREMHGSITAKASAKKSGDAWHYAYGTKLHLEAGDRLECNWTRRTTYSTPAAGMGNMGAAYYGKRAVAQICCGNYGARFGQGLIIWSGMSMSGVSTVAAFRRNGSGISTSSSYTSQMQGIAAEWSLSKSSLTTAYSWPGTAFVNWTIPGKTASWGATAIHDLVAGRSAASLDFRVGFAGLSLFGEAALEQREGKLSPAAVAGAIYTPKYGTRLALLGRYYAPGFSGIGSGAVRTGSKASDEAGISLGLQTGWVHATADLSRYPSRGSSQAKLIVGCSHEFQPTPLFCATPAMRLCIRGKDGNVRTDLRGELGIRAGAAYLGGRINLLWNSGFAWLWYAEAGGKWDNASSFLRFTLFKADSWEDRIYVYERDIPGAFSIPAYYGRGYSISWTGAVRLGNGGKWKHKLAARACATAYPWNLSERSPSSELKLQYLLSR